MKKTLFALLIILGLIGYSFYMNGNHEAKKEEKAAVGFKAPDFVLTGLDGKTYRLSDINKPVLINFWASWCGPCRAETPDLMRLYHKYDGKFEILAVNVTVNDKEENAKKFAAFFGMTFPVLFDRNGDVAEAYQVMAFPTNVFVDRHGTILHIADGVLPIQQVEQIVQQTIKR
ncbi:TlpA family protein disulfide reductase [Aneurinibacillus sp. BA2021]|nr:TlpA family protein disulfide reductase [Aneurinibacillus sp. BA2021]